MSGLVPSPPLLESRCTPVGSSGVPSAALELRDLRRSYGDKVALDGLSFGVGPGQIFGFVGPNGAGKTTAMRIVLGVLTADSGEVLWQGRPVGEEDRRRIGYMPEERGLYPKMRVAEQLSYLAQLHGLGRADADASATRWIDELEIGEYADKPLEQLSLGNQQRAQLAAALVHDPVLLVLDEPFSGLDPIGVDVLAGVLSARAAAGVPVVFSSHQLELVERMCEAVAIIKNGRLVASGGVEELRRTAAGRRWRVEVAGAQAGWAGAVDGVEALDDSTFVLTVTADEQALLDAARRAGRVQFFGPVLPSLADLFRDAVAA